MLSSWFRVIRVKFLLASVIAVCLGLAINWWQNQTVDITYGILTFVGVLTLHASVDLLNDYWDFKRKIDTKTQRTKFSGGTGVLPEGLLKPNDVYKAGGRKTLVIMLGKKKAATAVWVFPIVAYGIIISGILMHVLPIISLITFLTIPLLMKSGLGLKQNFNNPDKIVPTMGSFVSYSRITGMLLVLSFLLLSK